MSSTAARYRRLANERLPCSAKGCMSNRTYLGRFCKQHTIANKNHGHPNGHAVSRAALASYRDLFASVIDACSSHPAVSAAIEWMNQLISFGDGRCGDAAHQELRRLRDGGLDGREALAAVGAVWLWSHYYRKGLPDDERLTFALARHLTLCRPQTKRFAGINKDGSERHYYDQPPTTALRTLGKLIRDTLGPFFAQVVEYLEDEDRKRLAVADALRTPLTTITADHLPTFDEDGQ